MLTYQTIQELCQAAEAAGSTISQVILAGQAQQLGLEEREVYDRMAQRLQVMKESVQTGLDPALRSASAESLARMRSLSPSNTPKVMLEFPTTIASNIAFPPFSAGSIPQFRSPDKGFFRPNSP